MGKGVVDDRVWRRRDSRVVAAVFVILSDGTNNKSDALNDLKAEELKRG